MILVTRYQKETLTRRTAIPRPANHDDLTKRHTMTTAYPINPMYLLGKTFEFTEVLPCECGPNFECFNAQVLAVVVPAPGTDIEWSLLLLQDGFCDPDYHDLDALQFVWPIPI